MYRKSGFYSVDLFAGCGGLSEGFIQAGFDVIAQVEMDRWACETLRTRHLYHELHRIRKRCLYNKYLREEVSRDNILDSFPHIKDSISHSVIQATLGREGTNEVLERIEASKRLHGASKVNVLLGGPPCQCYSLVGRARDPFRMENDKRHYLYKYYLEILEQLKPDFFVYENVPGLFTAKARGNDIFKKVLSDFTKLNPPYEITPPLEKIYIQPRSYILNSADFYIPQKRKRIILIGYKKSLEYKNINIKNVFTKLQEKAIVNRKKGYYTVDDAIGDLPQLVPGEGEDNWWGTYENEDGHDLKSYQIKMRNNSPGVINHRARKHMKNDLERYKFFIEHHMNDNKSATLKDLIRERPDLIPEHKHLDKFLDRFKVQWWNHPSSTITAHICKDGHYYIHPDISQCRSFTVREAARCQSFPDNFKFEGPRTEQFKQVGNAVPPKLAKVIGKIICEELIKIYS